MSRETTRLSGLDTLTTEAASERGDLLDRMPARELVGLMNSLDAEVAEAVGAQLDPIAAAVEAAAERMAAGGRLIYVGAGTSGRLGVLDASEVPPTFGADEGIVVGLIAGGPKAIVSAVEAAEDNEEAGRADLDALSPTARDTVVGISSSGRTPYVVGALTRARELGALGVALSCNAGSPISALADHAIEVVVGPELIAGSTRLRAGTATKMVLNMLSTVTMVRLGKTYGTLMVDLRATNAKLRRRAVRIVTTATGADESQAEDALRSAGWSAKVAIAMIVTGLPAEEAHEALRASGDHLRDVLEGRR